MQLEALRGCGSGCAGMLAEGVSFRRTSFYQVEFGERRVRVATVVESFELDPAPRKPRRVRREVPSWLISFVFHFFLFTTISTLSVSLPSLPRQVELQSSVVPANETPPVVEPPKPEEFAFSDVPQEEIGAMSQGGTGIADGAGLELSDIVLGPGEAAHEGLVMADAALASAATLPLLMTPGAEAAAVTSGPTFNATRPVRGAVGVGTTGAEGAIDRITHEILLSLEERPTMIVWLFDCSGSLAAQRQTIHQRLEQIYRELGVIEASGHSSFAKNGESPLLTSMIGFGERIAWLTSKPTTDVATIKQALGEIKNDESGIERTFGAILQAVEGCKKYRQGPSEQRRNVMFIVFTDEVGDDQELLDQAIQACRKLEIPVYVVGVPAPFGTKESLIKYQPPKGYDPEPQYIPVVQGPESCEPELVQIGFGKSLDRQPMESGFGPYSLTRLCYETGGIFFTVHSNRDATRAISRQETSPLSAYFHHFFDPEVMRNYRPDYVSAKQYDKLLRENRARAALVKAALLPGVPPLEKAETWFPKKDEAALVEKLTVAQRKAAVLEPKIDQVYEILKQGEKDRPKLTQPRWQAGYDLAMGSVLAVKVRTESYNAMLAKAKLGLKFENPKNDTWELIPSDKVTAGSVLEKQAEQARTYLKQVVQQHAGTPWALLASEELKQPLSWEWHERHTGVNQPVEQARNNNNRPRPPRDDEKRMISKPLPKAPLPKL